MSRATGHKPERFRARGRRGRFGLAALCAYTRSMDRLVLFDIDMTLINSHGAGGRAIFAAIEETSTYVASSTVTVHGRTDPGIIVDLAVRWGAPVSEAEARLGAASSAT